VTVLNKLSGYPRTPHGLEWKILKKTPWMLFSSAIMIGVCLLLAHFMVPDGSLQETSKYLETINIMAIAIWIATWSMILTVAFAAFIVYLMKGPAYVWDPVEVTDSEEPAN
jgi:hypothetical protein